MIIPAFLAEFPNFTPAHGKTQATKYSLKTVVAFPLSCFGVNRGSKLQTSEGFG
jgi:hypothetical protein